MEISKRIFQKMEEQKIDQITLARMTGIGQSTISDWKRKGTDPSASKIMPICRALNCRPEDILEGD